MAVNWKRSWRYGLLAIVAYALGLAATLPAAHALQWLAPRLPAEVALRLAGVEGSVWDGRAARAQVAGVAAGEVRWRLRPLASLWRGAAVVGWSLRDGDDHLAGELVVGPGGAFGLHGLEGRVAAASLVRRAPAGLPVMVDGTVAFGVDTLEWRDGGIADAAGRLAWNAAAVTAPRRVALGDLRMTLTADAGALEGRWQDAGGPLEAGGTLRLAPDGSYRVDGRLAARPGAAPALAEGLRMLGPPAPDGGVRVEYTGRF